MYVSKATIDDQITTPLSRLLGLEITQVKSELQERDSPGTVFKASVFDKDQNEYPLILKRGTMIVITVSIEAV